MRVCRKCLCKLYLHAVVFVREKTKANCAAWKNQLQASKIKTYTIPTCLILRPKDIQKPVLVYFPSSELIESMQEPHDIHLTSDKDYLGGFGQDS